MEQLHFLFPHNGHADVVRVLLECGAEKETQTPSRSSPFFIASQNGHTDVAKVLLECGSETDTFPEKTSVYPTGQPNVVPVLSEHGAKDTERDDGTTLLDRASLKGQAAAVRHGPDRERRAVYGVSASQFSTSPRGHSLLTHSLTATLHEGF